jgi:guanylate cyclase 2F
MNSMLYKMLQDKLILMVNITPEKENSIEIIFILDLLWMSPEHVRTSIIKNDVATVITSSSAGDVYSFGIIMQEVILRGPPYCMLDLTPQGLNKKKNFSFELFVVYVEIIAKIKKPPPLLRPSVSKQVAPPEYINSMKQCWAEQAETRPSFNDLAQSIKALNGGK